MSGVKIHFEGMPEFVALLDEMKKDFGVSDQKKVLTTAVKQSMKPVLQTAKGLVAKDTGALANSLQVQARKPTNKDKKSIYVNPSDVVIGVVSTKPIPKKFKKEVIALYGHLKGSALTKAKRKYYQDKGSFWDARAIAEEFGTKTEFGSVHNAAKPYLRPALESQAPAVLNSLGKELGDALEKYRSKKIK
jgi:HK97 gp10 family phage protein